MVGGAGLVEGWGRTWATEVGLWNRNEIAVVEEGGVGRGEGVVLGAGMI